MGLIDCHLRRPEILRADKHSLLEVAQGSEGVGSKGFQLEGKGNRWVRVRAGSLGAGAVTGALGAGTVARGSCLRVGISLGRASKDRRGWDRGKADLLLTRWGWPMGRWTVGLSGGARRRVREGGASGWWVLNSRGNGRAPAFHALRSGKTSAQASWELQ